MHSGVVAKGVKIDFDISVLREKYGDKTAGTAIKYLAQNIRQTAKRSLKLARKRKKLPVPSEPGEAPRIRSSSSPLKSLMVYEYNRRELRATIGPALFPQARSPKVPQKLEHGGRSTVKVTEYADTSKRRRFKGTKKRDNNVNKYGESRANRPDILRETPKGIKKVGKYTYFYSRERYENAKASSGFQAWAKRRNDKTEKLLTVRIQPRPFMVVAAKIELTKDKIHGVFMRAYQNSKK